MTKWLYKNIILTLTISGYLLVGEACLFELVGANSLARFYFWIVFLISGIGLILCIRAIIKDVITTLSF